MKPSIAIHGNKQAFASIDLHEIARIYSLTRVIILEGDEAIPLPAYGALVVTDMQSGGLLALIKLGLKTVPLHVAVAELQL